jgi:hypothetical protein
MRFRKALRKHSDSLGGPGLDTLPLGQKRWRTCCPTGLFWIECSYLLYLLLSAEYIYDLFQRFCTQSRRRSYCHHCSYCRFSYTTSSSFILFYFILRYWGLNSGPSPRATPPALAVMGISEIGDHELFAWADFKSQSS